MSRPLPDFTELTIDLDVYDLKHLSAIIAQLRAKAVVAKVERVNGWAGIVIANLTSNPSFSSRWMRGSRPRMTFVLSKSRQMLERPTNARVTATARSQCRSRRDLAQCARRRTGRIRCAAALLAIEAVPTASPRILREDRRHISDTDMARLKPKSRNR